MEYHSRKLHLGPGPVPKGWINKEFVYQVGPLKWASRYFVRQFTKRILRKGVSLTLPTGLQYYAPLWDPSGTEVYVTNADVDWGSEKLLASILDRKGTFIDVGAHTGYYSLYMLPLVLWVYAFEPDIQSFSVLKEYQKVYNNFFPFRVAVSNKKRKTEISVDGKGFSSIIDTSAEKPKNTNPNRYTESIEAVTIDDYLDAYRSPVAGIKIDVDGPDLDVLEGSLRTIDKYRPIVLTELSSRDFNRLFSICNNIEYGLFAFGKSSNDPVKTSFLEFSNSRFSSQEKFNSARFKMIFLFPKEKRNLLTEAGIK